MRRRDFITLLGGAAAGWPIDARAQQQQAIPVIGFLSGRSPNDSAANVAAFKRGLSELGFLDGHNVEIDFRWALSHYDQLSALAGDLVRRKVTVIVATGGGVTSAQAAKAATATIPIVFVAGTDPVVFGLVDSMNKPGGNLTGVSFLIGALMGKNLELLHELVPSATAIGMLVNPNFGDTNVQVREAHAAAQTLGEQLVVVMLPPKVNWSRLSQRLSGIGSARLSLRLIHSSMPTRHNWLRLRQAMRYPQCTHCANLLRLAAS